MPKVPRARTTQRKGPLQGTRKAALAAVTDGASSSSEEEEHASNYLFHCALVDTEDPMITRMLSVPSTFTLDQMHVVLQIAFGWSNCHMWQFEMHNIFSSEEEEHAEYERNGNKPLTTFMTDPEDMRSWANDGDKYNSRYQETSEWKLLDIFEGDGYRGNVNLIYEYDMGDGWEHEITFLGVEDPGLRKALMDGAEFNTPLCFSGEGHPCAEDCGGTPGWEHLKAVFTKPRARDPGDLKTWYKSSCHNGDKKGLDPYKWSILDVNDRLTEMKA
ncbi:hypothetical protein PV11_05967 [Exophiala sideris]|uniref:Plasmid pRiA4b Orf3-like domain-containing protein n=1 Tax=Exophiala sideris TaxID=1016849 RepID=A0A0D1YM91_9EURO|nr:hypothetical protein PV11_05967 [Exophiala sideris]